MTDERPYDRYASEFHALLTEAAPSPRSAPVMRPRRGWVFAGVTAVAAGAAIALAGILPSGDTLRPVRPIGTPEARAVEAIVRSLDRGVLEYGLQVRTRDSGPWQTEQQTEWHDLERQSVSYTRSERNGRIEQRWAAGPTDLYVLVTAANVVNPVVVHQDWSGTGITLDAETPLAELRRLAKAVRTGKDDQSTVTSVRRGSLLIVTIRGPLGEATPDGSVLEEFLPGEKPSRGKVSARMIQRYWLRTGNQARIERVQEGLEGKSFKGGLQLDYESRTTRWVVHPRIPATLSNVDVPDFQRLGYRVHELDCASPGTRPSGAPLPGPC